MEQLKEMRNWVILVLIILLVRALWVGLSPENSTGPQPPASVRDTVVVTDTVVVRVKGVGITAKMRPLKSSLGDEFAKESTTRKYMVATMDTLIVSDRATVEMAVEYDESTRLFSFDALISARVDTIAVTETNYITRPPIMRYARFWASCGVATAKDEYTATVGAGIFVFDKLTIGCYTNTNKELGLSLGWVW